MKKSTKLFATAAAAVTILLSTQANAQKLGIGANVGVPTSKHYNFAAGADVRLQFNATKQLSIPVATGYTHFFAKDAPYILGGDVPDYAYIPLKTGLKYFLDPTGSGIYAMGEVGAAFGVSKDSKTTFLYAPTIGYSWSSGLDLGLKYENAGKGDALRYLGNNSGQIALRIAYGFKL